MDSAVARKAENEAIFRDANEEIEAVRHELSTTVAKTPFFCECDDANCREIVRLGVDEYESVRATPTTFLIARGHAYGEGQVVAENDSYLVVDKQGLARRVALETDPRSDRG